MATIFFYINSSKLDQVLRFGLKLSDNYSHTIPINNLQKRVFVGLLNPKDDLVKYDSEDYTCLKVDIYPEHCYVLNEVSLILTPKNGDYGLIPLNEYNYGFYENPRIVFNSSILPEQIEVLDDTIDVPILFESSKDLYYRIRVNELIDELDPSEVYFALCEYFDYKKPFNKSNLE